MRELIAARHIARSINVLHIRSKAIIYLYALRRILHSGFLQLQSVNLRLAANNDEQQVTLRLVIISDDKNRVRMASGRPRWLQDKTHAFALQDALHQFLHFSLSLGSRELVTTVTSEPSR